MAEKLSIIVGLEGGKEVQQQLADISKAGQQAFLDISKAAQDVGGFKNLKPEEVTAKLKEMGQVGQEELQKIQNAVASATRIEQLVQGIQKVENAFASLGEAAAAFGRALGPIAVVGVALGTKLVKSMNEASKAISEADAAAIKFGTTIEKFDTLRQGFEKAGISANAFASGMEKVKQAAEKADLDKVTKAVAALEDAQKRGFGIQGMPGLNLLVEMAGKVGPAADKAREALEKLGVTVKFDSAVGSLQQLIEKTGSAEKGLAAFVEQLRNMPDSVERNAIATSNLGDKLGTELIQALRNGAVAIDQFKERAGTLTQAQANAAAAAEEASNRMIAAWERFKQTGDLSQLGAAWKAVLDQVALAWAPVMNAASQAMTAIGSGISDLISKIGDLAQSITGSIWDTFANAGKSAIDAVGGAIDWLVQKFKDAAQWAGSVFGGGSGGSGDTTPAPGMASGGLIGGRGSGTSDSNLAWVSRGEHIMPAAAVSQPGVLAFLEALRASGGDLRRVLAGLGRFAMGGPVGLPMAIEGLSGAGRNLGTLTLNMPDGTIVTGVSDQKIVDALRRAASMGQVRSGGRKPSRYQ